MNFRLVLSVPSLFFAQDSWDKGSRDKVVEDEWVNELINLLPIKEVWELNTRNMVFNYKITNVFSQTLNAQ